MKIRTCSLFGDCDAPESIREKIRATLNVLIDCKINVFIVGNKGNFAKMVKEELMRLFPEYPWIFCFIMSCDPESSEFKEITDRDLTPEDLFDEIFLDESFEICNEKMISMSRYVVIYSRNPEDFACKCKEIAEKKGKSTVLNL